MSLEMTGLSLGLTEVLRQCVSLCNQDIHTKDTEQTYIMDDSKIVHKNGIKMLGMTEKL